MAVITCKSCGSKNRVVSGRADGKVPLCGKCKNPLEVPASEPQSGKPISVNDSSFQSDIINSSGVVLLDCWAPWCGPCRMIGPIMDQLAAESDGRYRIAKLNVDENPRTSAQFGIQSIPTMLLFKDGKLIDRIIGAQPKRAIAARLAQAV